MALQILVVAPHDRFANGECQKNMFVLPLNCGFSRSQSTNPNANANPTNQPNGDAKERDTHCDFKTPSQNTINCLVGKINCQSASSRLAADASQFPPTYLRRSSRRTSRDNSVPSPPYVLGLSPDRASVADGLSNPFSSKYCISASTASSGEICVVSRRISGFSGGS